MVLNCVQHLLLNTRKLSHRTNLALTTFTMTSLHVKCRNCAYSPTSNIVRFPVPDDKVSWNVEYSEYKPVTYTHPTVMTASWADPDILCGTPINPPLKFNEMDGGILRKSFCGTYVLSMDGLPLNPCGRTGIRGRALLGKWGPNHAADPIVTRWKRDSTDRIVIHPRSRLPVLQFVSIQRRDTGEWAIPGGMVDSGEVISETLKREFGEEALASLQSSACDQKKIQSIIHSHLRGPGVLVYQGYVDDPRNTDNAWMETQAYYFHDDSGKGLGRVQLKSGDDAIGVRWTDVSSDLKLYASHSDFIKTTSQLLKAHW